MPFWKSESEEERAKKEFQKRSLEEIENGGLPLFAQERLKREAALGRKFFSSDLTATEFMLCKQGEFQTVGQVLGSCFYMVPNYGRGWYMRTSGSAYDLEAAMTAGYGLAIDRLQQEATLLNAHGVIGVRLTQRRPKWERTLSEFTAVGTAIRLPNYKGGGRPFTSLLNGQEFWQLYQAGYIPDGIAYGIGACYVVSNRTNRAQTGRGFWGNFVGNVEVDDHTEALRYSQESAESKFSQAIGSMAGDGAVGVMVERNLQDIEYEINDVTYHDLLSTFQMRGTVVTNTHAPIPDRGGLMIYDLRGKSRTSKGTSQSGTEDSEETEYEVW